MTNGRSYICKQMWTRVLLGILNDFQKLISKENCLKERNELKPKHLSWVSMSPFDFTPSFLFFFILVSQVAFWQCARACPNVIKANNYDNKIRNWGKSVLIFKNCFGVHFIYDTLGKGPAGYMWLFVDMHFFYCKELC